MTPRRPRPLCAICADRDATTITDWECESGATRTIVACWPCLSPVPDPPEEYEPIDLSERCTSERISARTIDNHDTRRSVVAAVRALGEATTSAICAAVGAVDDVARATVTKQVSRLVKLGALTARDIFPGRPKAGRIYTATGAPMLSASMRAIVARLPDGEFRARDVSDVARDSTAAIKALIEQGVIEVVRREPTRSRPLNVYRRKEQAA